MVAPFNRTRLPLAYPALFLVCPFLCPRGHFVFRWAKSSNPLPMHRSRTSPISSAKSLNAAERVGQLGLSSFHGCPQGPERSAMRPTSALSRYSFRHTFLTRLGESGCDAWTLARIAGQSNIAISQRYVHPSGDAVLLAMSRLVGTILGTLKNNASSSKGE